MTVATDIITYLSKFSKNAEQRANTAIGLYYFPNELTQEGIGRALGKTTEHISFELNKLIREGLVDTKCVRVEGRKKKVHVYLLKV